MHERPKLMGVVNVTPDSFSDGGLYLDPEHAAARARQLWADGADVVDLGAASSHPDAPPVSPEEEIRRLAPVLDRLAGEEARLSVDSARTTTQRFALERGVAMLNDVRGFADASLHPELARRGARLVVMHMRDPRDAPLDAGPLLSHIATFLSRRVDALERAGVKREQIVLDPGMGLFLSPDPEPSWIVLRHLRMLREHLGLPLLVGISRKSPLGALTGRPPLERGPAGLAAELYAAAHGADYIRTHDVRALRDALRVQETLDAVEPARWSPA